MDEHFFDDLAKGLDDGTITRRRALKLVGAAALGTALMPVLPKQAQALTPKARRRCRRKGGIPVERGYCHCTYTCTSTGTFPCNGTTNCICVELALNGRGFCAANTGNFTGSDCLTNGCPFPYSCVVKRNCIVGVSCTTNADCGGYTCMNGSCELTGCMRPCPTQ